MCACVRGHLPFSLPFCDMLVIEGDGGATGNALIVLTKNYCRLSRFWMLQWMLSNESDILVECLFHLNTRWGDTD